MKILIVGNRSIQHLLAERLKHEDCLVEVYPGQKFGRYTSVNSDQVLASNYDLIVMGSARYFDDPIISELRSRGTPYFGPDHSSAGLETSKEEFKRFAQKYRIPTPKSAAFTDYTLAVEYLKTLKPPFVIKADGPARGCGVTICHTLAEAKQDLARKLKDQTNLYYCGRVVLERFVEGFEVAINVFLDSANYILFPATKPHKRRNNGDSGPMVAGMGSVSPILLNDTFYKEFEEDIIKPTIAGITREDWTFRGCLFVNLMVTDNKVFVLEFNCRMGDPAMLVDLLLLESNLIDLLVATAQNKLSTIKPVFKNNSAAAAVTLIDPRYPESQVQQSQFAVKPDQLFDINTNAGLLIAGAQQGTTQEKMMVNSGVVMTALALGSDHNSAIDKANSLASSMPRFHSRTDIGLKRTPPVKYAAES